MGEVYRARDTKLDRDVAIKTLPDSFAADADRLMRFEREAKTLASLNHPNIAAIYGLEAFRSGGSSDPPAMALVMELVEGEDLSQRIARGAIPLDEALPIAKQIAEALEAAHEQGIIHRDLKPANIKVRADGTVKVLDFGLAKALGPSEGDGFSRRQAEAEASALRTVTSPAMTQAGIILGTASYMSPEQARGKRVDKRADIWAFGCVLYEMLTGRCAFEGESLTDVLGAVVRGEPDWTRLPAGTPGNVRKLLTRCLRKDTATRWRDIGDAAIELTEIEPGAVTASPTASRVAPLFLWIAAAVATIGAATGGWMAGQSAAPAPIEEAPIRASLPLPPNTAFASGIPAVSPDGNRIVVMLSDDKGQVQLWQRSLAASEFRPIPNTSGATSVFWSPDARSIAFVSSGQLRRIDLAGDRVETVAELKGRVLNTGAWGADDTILIATTDGGPLWRVDAKGGELAPATSLDEGAGERHHTRPTFLGDTRWFVFEGVTLGPLRVVRLASLDDASSSTVLLDSDLVRSTAATAGHLLFKTNSTLFAQPIDVAAKRLVGAPQRVQEEGLLAAIVPTVSPRVLAHIDGSRAGTALQWRDRAGRLLDTITSGGNLIALDLSPDGSRLAYVTVNPASGRSEIVVTSVADGRTSIAASSDGSLSSPVWSADSQELAYMAFEKNASGVYRLRLDSTSPPERLIDERTGVVAPSDWTTDGTRLIWKRFGGSTGNDVMVMPLAGDRKSLPLVSSPASENTGKVSPDRRWLAYSSNVSGRDEVYVQPFPDGGRRWQVSRAGGNFPRWRGDGRELLFYAGNAISAAEISLGTVPQIGAIKTLFAFERRPSNVNEYPYAVTPDGQRFVVNARIYETPMLSIVVNWQAALRQGARGAAAR